MTHIMIYGNGSTTLMVVNTFLKNFEKEEDVENEWTQTDKIYFDQKLLANPDFLIKRLFFSRRTDE